MRLHEPARASIRLKHLNLAGLDGAERHGKREDAISQARSVHNVPPLRWSTEGGMGALLDASKNLRQSALRDRAGSEGLNLRKAFDKATDGIKIHGCVRKPVIHALMQFPPELADKPNHERALLVIAARFCKHLWGENAAFAARVDRDEKGRCVVDMFLAPTYEKTTKAGTTTWLSTTRHLKQLCRKHQSEIKRRFHGKFSDNVRARGMALQSEFNQFLVEQGIPLEPKREKPNPEPDWLTPEHYGVRAERRAREAQQDANEAEAIADEAMAVAHKRIEDANRQKRLAEQATRVVARRIAKLVAKAAMVAVGKWRAGSPA